MIELPPLGDLENALWLVLLDIAERRPADWTLVGGQMVLLHALEHGGSPPRISTDLDLVVDARAHPPAIPAMAETLERLGFRVEGIAPDGVGHRFVRGPVTIDVLAPEGAASAQASPLAVGSRRSRSGAAPTHSPDQSSSRSRPAGGSERFPGPISLERW
jgi:hypothetical protein